MVEKTKKLSEDEISTLLQRYSATTVLTLLQEVAQVVESKIDWNVLVKNTTTGISNPREYQMLWRHLAYRDTLVERLDNGAEPLDDDSDLDCELEALPPVGYEASTEAAACVKVLIASGLQSDTSLSNWSTVEAPLTINIPNGQSSRDPSGNSQMQGKNITIPVSVQKQPLPTVTSVEGLDANGSVNGNLPSRRKRKLWSTAEDQELIDAVKRFGEGNWATILKEGFKGDRTASQLSQRWAIIRKRQKKLNVGGGGSQLSEAQLAARRAVSLALDMPKADNLTAACSNGSSVGTQSQHQSRQDSGLPTLSKSRVASKKPSTKPGLSPDAMVKAAAVAAGARIATPSDAASLLKAVQANNTVHIMPGGGSIIKSSVAGNANTLPPNVHFIRTGLTATSLSNYPAGPTNAARPGGTQQAPNSSLKPAAQIVQLNSTRIATQSNPSAEVSNAVTSRVSDAINSTASNPSKEQVHEDQVVVLGNAPREQIQEAQAAVTGNALEEEVQEDQASISGNLPNDEVQEGQTAIPSSESILKSQSNFVENSQCQSSPKEATVGRERRDDNEMVGIEEGRDNQSVEKTFENQILNGKEADLQNIIRDAGDENRGIVD